MALFLPYSELGVIVVDEGHEPTFKQEDGVQYHARDTAVMRGLFEAITVVLLGDPSDREPAWSRSGVIASQPAPAFRRGLHAEIRAISLTQDRRRAAVG